MKNIIYGYARISTNRQSLERQVRNIENYYKDSFIVKEVFTGTKQDRPEWNKLLKVLKENDTIIFDSVSRMSRNAKEGFNEYKYLYDKNINLIFLKEPHINTSTYKDTLNKQVSMTGDDVDYILEGVNKYLMALAEKQIKLAFEQSEKEVTDLHQRTKEGIETARRNGKQIGQKKGNVLHIKKKGPIKEYIKNNSKSFYGSLTDKQIISVLKDTKFKVPVNPNDPKSEKKEIMYPVSTKTYYLYKKELKEELYEMMEKE